MDLEEVVVSVLVVEAQVAGGKPIKVLLICLFFATLPIAVFSQSTNSVDTLRADLDLVLVTASRNLNVDQQTPFSVSTRIRPESVRLSSTLSSTDQLLGLIAGVMVFNRDNYSLGERLNIRGSGWRSSFGVRGIQVLIDGLPLTSPDGQTILELVDPNLITQTQVIRGPSALFWGNGSGGTIYFQTNTPQEGTSIRTSAGSYGLRQNDLTHRSSSDVGNVQFSFSDFRIDGYRDHSKAHIIRANLSYNRSIDQHTRLGYQLYGIHAPDIKNPGSLTLNEFNSSPNSANPQFITQNAGKSYSHLVHGLNLGYEKGNIRFESVLHNTFRSLENPITPSIIEIQRVAGGSRNSLSVKSGSFNYSFSMDFAYQRDKRYNWANVRGTKGSLSVDQVETVGSGGIAAIIQYEYLNWSLMGGLRTDLIYFKASDNLETSFDASGDRWMQAFTPKFGVNYNIGLHTIYSGITTSFESPTTTELVNRPDLQRGFNEELNPERSIGIELGARGYIQPINITYDVAIFRQGVSDRLTSYQTAAGGDRTFFENSGKTIHTGFETYLNADISEFLNISVAYTYTDFRFSDSQDNLNKNLLPGIPQHHFRSETVLNVVGVKNTIGINVIGKQYANNVNSVEIPGYHIVNYSIAYPIELNFGRKSVSIIPFASVRNALNESYAASVSINAFGGRFFEPGMPRNYLGGLSIQF